jgi:ankyrin repeat protein
MKKCLTLAMVRTELKRMPETLDQTYDRILQSVPSLHESFVQSALHWLAFATRPLQLQELAEAAVLSPESGSFEPDVCRLLDENLILELCGTLVTASAGVVSLSHYSVKEYIASQRLQKGALSSFYTSKKLANTYLAKCCLFYLLEFNRGEIVSKLDFRESPLLEYSACNWMSHWKHASTDGQSDLHHLAERFFDPSSSNAYVNWLNVWIPETNLESHVEVPCYRRSIRKSAKFYPPTLYWAASLGDLALVQSLVENGANVMKRGGKFESPLGAAAYHGHSDVVEYLLRQGANPNLPSRYFGNVLQIAALGGSVKVVKQLIDAGADVNAQGGGHNTSTALVAAASKDHIDVVILLVKHGADLNIGSRFHGSPLYQAAAAGGTKTVITLLGAGADINGIGDSGGTPLYAAAESGSLSLVQLLLQRGADVNKGALSAPYGYPVTTAAREGHSQVVRTLIRAGANVNLSMGRRGMSTLEAAVAGRDMPTLLAVLDAGADPNASGQLYINGFHAAIRTGDLAMAKILLERGAEFEDEGFLEAVLDKLLEKNPNYDAWRSGGGSALHVAIEVDNAFLDAVSEDGSPLGVAIEKDMIDLAKELIRQGADVNRRVKGDSPFGLAINHAFNKGNSDLTLADMLLKHGADINVGTRGW